MATSWEVTGSVQARDSSGLGQGGGGGDAEKCTYLKEIEGVGSPGLGGELGHAL